MANQFRIGSKLQLLFTATSGAWKIASNMFWTDTKSRIRRPCIWFDHSTTLAFQVGTRKWVRRFIITQYPGPYNNLKIFISGLDILDHIIDEIHPFYVIRSISNKLQFEIETQVAPKLSGLNWRWAKTFPGVFIQILTAPPNLFFSYIRMK